MNSHSSQQQATISSARDADAHLAPRQQQGQHGQQQALDLLSMTWTPQELPQQQMFHQIPQEFHPYDLRSHGVEKSGSDIPEYSTNSSHYPTFTPSLHVHVSAESSINSSSNKFVGNAAWLSGWTAPF